MIFVTLGTQDKQFNRLASHISLLVSNKKIKEEVVIQAGCTKVSNKDIKVFKQLSYEEMLNYFKKCDIVITHGGVGSITDALLLGKKVIAVPRKKEYKEAVNNHQEEIIDAFVKEGFLLKAETEEELEEKINEIRKFKPKKYISNTDNFIKKLESYMDKF